MNKEFFTIKDNMKLEEILKQENNGKKYLCLSNGAIVKNEDRTLVFLNRQIKDGKEQWCKPEVNFIWVESKYEEVI